MIHDHARWAAAFDAPVYLHARDREWVMRPDDRVVFWEEDERALAPGLTLLRLGGHFPGGSVLHWRDGAEGRGALLAGDIVGGRGSEDRLLLWSDPNWLPLSGGTVVSCSAARYRDLLAQDQP